MTSSIKKILYLLPIVVLSITFATACEDNPTVANKGTDSGTDGDSDGDSDGDADGDADGDSDGDADGDADGDSDGDADGDADGDSDSDQNLDAGPLGDDPLPEVNFPSSTKPPGGLAASKTPMFVMFAFDDNAFADSVTWFADLVKNKTNPDGTPVRATFLLTGGYSDSGGDELVNVWKRLYSEGHEIGNHTWTHGDGIEKDKAWWTGELTQTRDFFKDEMKIPTTAVWGFRTPFLKYKAVTFEVLDELELRYDCSVEYGYNVKSTEIETGESYSWPYTLDDGAIYGSSTAWGIIFKAPGLWEIPVYTYNTPNAAETSVTTTTGFDFNLWKKLPDADTVLKTLKYSFDQRYRGNRSPFSLNAHSDYYSKDNTDVNDEFHCKDYLERRQVLEDFLEYVRTFDEVRVVPIISVLRWMNDPKPLD